MHTSSVPPPTDGAPGAGPRSAGLHYRAVVAAAGRPHELLLYVQRRDQSRVPQRDAVAHAATLAAAEPLVSLLERWFEVAIDPQPTLAFQNDPYAERRTGATLSIRIGEHSELAPAGTELTLPRALLMAVAPPPEALRSAAVHWPWWNCRVILDTIAASAIAHEQLVIGSLLLLPGSYVDGQAGWPVLLAPQDTAHDLAAGWSLSQRSLRIAANTATLARQVGKDWRVVAEGHVAFEADNCLFGAPTRQVTVPFEAPGAARLMRGDAAVATGSLIGAGRGYGLLIESLPGSPGADAADAAATGQTDGDSSTAGAPLSSAEPAGASRHDGAGAAPASASLG